MGVAATTASGRAALVAPLGHLGATPTLVYAEQEIGHLLPSWVPVPAPARLPRSVQVVLADGHYLGLGHDLWAEARERGLPYLMAQHGLITPLAPPLAPGGRLLAWTAEDGRFWGCTRGDVSYEVVGSQLLWTAGTRDETVAGEPFASDGPAQSLTYLGQGHAAEISRARLVQAAWSTCREHGAVYRPHPSESDSASRAVLAGYARAGITVDTRGVPLVDLTGPIVSVFSTGVLEAAARGRDAWVDFPRPPAWLGEFWERYGMHRLGSSPTPAPALPPQEPARRIAEIVTEAAS
ncbi:RNA-binding protein [Nocardioides alpinus]|uniref:RNA-binding protein n=1 Tax=Nocardioides alpinus TaxID=748909 RepID=A0ABX4QSM3_9ACTN|nr:RNA-binding protein [Nocardioides alpinus]